MNNIFTHHNYYLSLLVSMTIILISVSPNFTHAAYPPQFFNQTGCLYSYIDEGGEYHISLPDSESQSGRFGIPAYDASASKCAQDKEHGTLVVKFDPETNNYMESMTLTFTIQKNPNTGFWMIPSGQATINGPPNPDLFPSKTFDLKLVDMYADYGYSYSCSKLVLKSTNQAKNMPRLTITLKRFQIQPFGELPESVFAPSQDCSVWITMPLLMGAALVLFMTFTVMIGVYLLVDLGNQSSDLKFSKQGGMLMNQAQLDATKG